MGQNGPSTVDRRVIKLDCIGFKIKEVHIILSLAQGEARFHQESGGACFSTRISIVQSTPLDLIAYSRRMTPASHAANLNVAARTQPGACATAPDRGHVARLSRIIVHRVIVPRGGRPLRVSFRRSGTRHACKRVSSSRTCTDSLSSPWLIRDTLDPLWAPR